MIDFSKVKAVDEDVYDLIIKEYQRQDSELEMIASENRPSEAVLLAQASYHTLKYAEGYPEARYYAGCENIDKTEQLAIDRACELFNCKYANVQPHSGASAWSSQGRRIWHSLLLRVPQHPADAGPASS